MSLKYLHWLCKSCIGRGKGIISLVGLPEKHHRKLNCLFPFDHCVDSLRESTVSEPFTNYHSIMIVGGETEKHVAVKMVQAANGFC